MAAPSSHFCQKPGPCVKHEPGFDRIVERKPIDGSHTLVSSTATPKPMMGVQLIEMCLIQYTYFKSSVFQVEIYRNGSVAVIQIARDIILR